MPTTYSPRRRSEWLVAGAAGREDVLVACGWRTFATDPAVPLGEDVIPHPGGLFPRLIHNNVAPPHSYLCSRRMANAIGRFAVDLRSCEDWDYWLRLTLAGAEFASVPHVGAYYRQTPGSMSTNQPRMLATRAEVLLRTHAEIAKSPELLSKWGRDLAVAALRVRRRLRVQGGQAELIASVTAMLDSLGRAGFRPLHEGKGAVLTRLVGREWADRLLLAYYRRFDKPAYRALQHGHW